MHISSIHCVFESWLNMNTETCLNVIVHKLNEFAVHFGKDIVAITTDGFAMKAGATTSKSLLLREKQRAYLQNSMPLESHRTSVWYSKFFWTASISKKRFR